MLKEQRCGVSQFGDQMSKYVGQTKTLQSILYYNLDSSLVKKVEGNLIDHHFENVYISFGVTMTFFFHILINNFVFFIGSVIVGCVYKDLHELLLRNQSTGEELDTSR